MELILNRRPTFGNATIGELYIDAFECFTLEDVMRPPGVKVYGQTAIPEGRYRIEMLWWEKHNASFPHLIDVPMFQGILIHGGNVAAHTEGCLLVGQEVGSDGVSIVRSQAALAPLVSRIKTAINSGQQVWITINNPPQKELIKAA